MLILSRKQSQRVKLGDSIVVTVLRVSGDKVRLGIEAPSDVIILREELESCKSWCSVEESPPAAETGPVIPATLQIA